MYWKAKAPSNNPAEPNVATMDKFFADMTLS